MAFRIHLRLSVLLLAGALAGCANDDQSKVPLIKETTYRMQPAKVSVRIGALSGHLSDLVVTQRVNEDTGEVVVQPHLRGTLKLKNTSEDQAVRVVNGRVEYLDGTGGRIPLAETRKDTSFRLYSYSNDRLDPGMETSQSIEVPFPAAALKAKSLATVRLDLTYIPAPY
ncbi:MAG: hypothetical protein ACRDQ2_13710, partial [Gaiellales bacterium]